MGMHFVDLKIADKII